MLLDIPTPKFGVSSETRGGGAWLPVGVEGAAGGEKLLSNGKTCVQTPVEIHPLSGSRMISPKPPSKPRRPCSAAAPWSDPPGADPGEDPGAAEDPPRRRRVCADLGLLAKEKRFGNLEAPTPHQRARAIRASETLPLPIILRMHNNCGGVVCCCCLVGFWGWGLFSDDDLRGGLVLSTSFSRTLPFCGASTFAKFVTQSWLLVCGD